MKETQHTHRNTHPNPEQALGSLQAFLCLDASPLFFCIDIELFASIALPSNLQWCLPLILSRN